MISRSCLKQGVPCVPRSSVRTTITTPLPSKFIRQFSGNSSLSSDTTNERRRRHLWTLTTLGLWLGVGCVGFWSYSYWRESREIWPASVAPHLRKALYAKHKGEVDESEQCFRQALDLLLQTPVEDMRGDPHLKITGVAISLADLLETQGKSNGAYDIYSDAVTYLRRVGASAPLTGPESLRLLSLSYKLGQLASDLKLPESEEERWLTAAVEDALKASKLPTNPASGEETGQNSPQTFGGVIELPEWATTTDIAAPLEALGEFYARQGKLDHALPLYLHSTSILIPPKSAKRKTSPEEKCRGANTMLQISDLILRGSLNEDALHQAGAWAQKGLDVVKDVRASSWRSVPACDEMLVAAYHGVAYMKELSGDVAGARRLYELAVKQANALGLAEESETITKHLVTLKTQK